MTTNAVIGFVAILYGTADIHSRQQCKNERLQERYQQFDQVQKQGKEQNHGADGYARHHTTHVVSHKNQTQ